MADFFWSTGNPNRQDVRTESGETVAIVTRSMGAIAADAGNFVWQPGGAAGGNIFTDFALLAAAIAAVPGEKTVAVDTSFVGGTAHIPAGVYAGVTDVTWVGALGSPILGGIVVDDGAHFLGVKKWTLDSLAIDYNGVGSAAILVAGGATEFVMRNGAQLGQAGGSAFFEVDAGGTLVVFAHNSLLNAGVITVDDVTGFVDIILTGHSQLATGTVVATALGAVNITADGSAQAGIAANPVGTIAPTIVVEDPQPTFVFQPGGTAGGNVFTSWAALMARVSLSPGVKTIVVDDSLGAAHATTGTWNLESCTLTGAALDANTLIIDDGCHFTFGVLVIDGTLEVLSNALSAVVASTTNQILFLRGASLLVSNTATPFVAVTGASEFEIFLEENSAIGDGTHPVIDAAVGPTVIVFLIASSVVANGALAGLGTIFLDQDSSSTVGTHTVTTLTTTLLDRDVLVRFTATTAANWNPNPTNVRSALDQLAAPNFTQASGNTGTGTGAVTVTTGNITKAKNGQMNVSATISGVTTSATTVTLQLVRDAATNIGNPIVVTTLSAGDGFTGAIKFIDTAPDTNPHTYKLTATAGAGNLTVAANSAQIAVSEGS